MSLWKYLTTKKPQPVDAPKTDEPKTDEPKPAPRDEKVYIEITAADRLDFIQRTGRILEDDQIDALLLRDEAWVRPRLVDELIARATHRQYASYGGSYLVADEFRIAQLRDLLLYGKLPPHGRKKSAPSPTQEKAS